MFKIILGVLQSFLSIIGYLLIGIVLIVILGPELEGICISIVFGIIGSVLLFSGIYFDRKMRKKYNLTHKKAFSFLWTTISIIEFWLFYILVLNVRFGLIPVSVLIFNILIYLVLSILILYRKIKKIQNNQQ